MTLTGLHLLLTYECNLECDHCFVWSSPQQRGTMTLTRIEHILEQARDLGTVEWIYYEGGEPFLYSAILGQGARLAASMGFRVGIVSNGYWATEVKDAIEWLEPYAGIVQDLSISSDDYHWGEEVGTREANARAAAGELGIPVDVIRIAPPEAADVKPAIGKLPPGESRLMFRGRAAQKLASLAPRRDWKRFSECPFEDLREPGRVHVDPLGYLHVCQGISLGNVLRTSLREICRDYEPDRHPITGPLLAGGPAGLVRTYHLPHAGGYADACHLCYEARCALRRRFPEILGPDQMYGGLDPG